jgi:signal transduction histidine kinase/CheY-like chemotaxis protein
MRGLFRRYVATLAGLVSASVLTVGTILALYHYYQDRQRAHEIQTANARAASASINSYLRSIESVLHSLAMRSREGTAASRGAQASDFRDALKFLPAILNVRALNDQFQETNFVSRLDADRIESMLPQMLTREIARSCSAAFCYGDAFIRDQTEPHISVIATAERGQEILAADITVRFIDDLLSKMSIGKAGRAYVVDYNGRLLAHPDLRTLLLRSDASQLPQVRQVLKAISQEELELPSVWGESPSGGTVFSSATLIAGTRWLLFVEQPAEEVLSAVRTTIEVTILVLALGIAAASLVALLLARRLAKPILLLRDGAQRLGGGDLSAKIAVGSRDEIESVATAFNNMAESLRTLYESLEAKVLSRTRDLALANEQVTKQAQELYALNQKLSDQLRELDIKRQEADRANAAKTRFVAAASHDLRQPMHAVGLLVGILADRQISPEVSGLLAKIQHSVSALEDLFERLLDISKLEAGIVAPNYTCFSMQSLLDSLEFAYSQTATDKGLEFRVCNSQTLVYSDSALLLSALGNLISNAIRYTEAGRIDVFCRKSIGQITVYVCDTGIGIPADQLERVFEEFYQLDGMARDRGQGLGLGLAIVKRTAELLGHCLVARSVLGAGSVFAITLPLAGFSQIKDAVARTSEPQDSPLPGAFIVVLDDDDQSRFATESIFRLWGCHVISGTCGSAIRHELSQHLRLPDLIVADFWFGDAETGLTIIRQLRKDAEVKIPAIILTADQNIANATSTKDEDIILIQKPANASRIRRVVLELFRRARSSEHQEFLSE